jgi:hypothetical protein
MKQKRSLKSQTDKTPHSIFMKKENLKKLRERV